MSGPGAGEVFARVVTPHLPAAYRLALWLLRDQAAPEDVVQDAAERAYRHIATFRGDNACAWVLRIVRNQAIETLKKTRPSAALDEELPDQARCPTPRCCAPRAKRPCRPRWARYHLRCANAW